MYAEFEAIRSSKIHSTTYSMSDPSKWSQRIDAFNSCNNQTAPFFPFVPSICFSSIYIDILSS